MIKNAEFSGYYFYMKMNIKRDVQSCFKTAFSLLDIICALHIITRENLFALLLSNILISNQ